MGGSGDRALPDEGIHQARCIRVIDFGTQETEWQGNKKEQRQVRMVFELVDTEHVFKEENGPEPFVVSNTYTLSLSEKSHLYNMILKWNKGVIEKLKEENNELDMKVFLGAPALINVVHSKDRNGNDWANIGDKGRDVMHRGKQDIPDPKNPKVYFNVDWLDDDADKADKMIDEDLWPGEKKKVIASIEFKEKRGEYKEPTAESAEGDEEFEATDEDPGF